MMMDQFELYIRKPVNKSAIFSSASKVFKIEGDNAWDLDKFFVKNMKNVRSIGIEVTDTNSYIRLNVSIYCTFIINEPEKATLAMELSKRCESEVLIGDYRRESDRSGSYYLSFFPNGRIAESTEDDDTNGEDIVPVRFLENFQP